MSRVRARVEGTVQGVGFRPYVYRLAGELGVAGHVLNDSRGVVVEVEAPPETVERFLARLPVEAPPLATVERVTAEQLEELGELGFSIRESPAGGEPRAAVTPDSATCADCLAELFDPADQALSLSVHQLHELRPPLHDRARRSLRPAEHDDGGLRDVRRVPGGVPRSARPPLPRPAERLRGLRAAGAPRLRRRGSGCRCRRTGCRRGGCACAARRGDRRREGHRRLPPRLPGR